MNSFLLPLEITHAELPEEDRNTLTLAFDGDSPASFPQRIQLASAVAMSVYKNRTGPQSFVPKMTLDASRFCELFSISMLKSRNVLKNADNVLARDLMADKRNTCGRGLLRYITVFETLGESGSRAYATTFYLTDKVDTRFEDGSFKSKSNLLYYILELKVQPHRFLQLTNIMFRETHIHQYFIRNYKQSSLGFDIVAGLEAIQDALTNESQTITQAQRVLENYDVYSFYPTNKEQRLTIRRGLRTSEIDSEFLIHAPARANASRTHLQNKQAVLSIRNISNKKQNELEMIFGEARLSKDIQLEASWKAVGANAHYSIAQAIEKHANALATTGIGSMYGPNSSFAKMSQADKDLYIQQKKIPGSNPAPPIETSCVGFVLNQLNYAYTHAGLGERWAAIERNVRQNNGQGTYLVNELRKDGWKTIYWNPDARNPTNRVVSPSIKSDHHIWTYAMARDGKGYMAGVLSFGKIFEGIAVDYLMLNYRPTDFLSTDTNLEAHNLIRKIPFFVGVANGGYHVYMGAHGMVIESHSTRNPSDQTNIEVRPFNQFGLLKGESYLSGVIAVPPGDWMKSIEGNYIQ